MKNELNAPHNDYSVDEILAEAKISREKEKPEADSGNSDRPAGPSSEAIARDAMHALKMETADEPLPPRKSEEDHPENTGKKKKRSFFHRQKQEEESIPEDDIYYGLQLKSLDEYRREYEETISIDTSIVKEAQEALHRKRRAINEAVWGNEEGPPPTEARQHENEKAEQTVPSASPVKQKPEQLPNLEKVPERAIAKKAVPAETSCATPVEGGTKPPSVTAAKPGQPSAPAAEADEAAAVKTAAAAESGVKPQAVPVVEPETDDRREWLERIFRHAGLDDENPLDPEIRAPGPEFPAEQPHPPASPVMPPVPPSIEPGPPLEPEQRPPVQEPPLAPSPATAAQEPELETKPEAETGFSPEAAEESFVQAEEFPCAEGTAPFPEMEPDDSTFSELRAGDEEPPTPVKEPVAQPQQKEGIPQPPQVKEPPRRETPRYRSDSLPLHVINLSVFDDALAAEAAEYHSEPPRAPEPIAFPAVEKKSASVSPGPEISEAEPPPKPEEFGKIRAIPTPRQLPETKKSHRRFRIFGSDEDPTPPDRPAEEQQDELEDYSNAADAPAVLNDLQGNVRKLFLRFLVTLFFSLLLAGFTAAWEHPSLLPAQIHSTYTAQNFMIVQLIFLTASAAFCAPVMRSGISGLLRLQANSDSAVAVAVLAALAQNVVSLFAGSPAGGRLYASLAALALFLNTAGKLSISKRILRNFRFLSSPEEKYAVQIYDDYNTAIQMSKSLTSDGPKIAYQSKAGFLRHFLKHSYAPDPSEHVSQILAPAGFLGSVVLFIVSALLTKNSLVAFASFTAGACLSVPFGAALSVSLPLARLNRISARCGGMAVGWDAVERFSATDAVLVDAQELFPRGTVVLNGIQTFAGQRIDEAILDATALTSTVGGTLSDLFSQIVKARGEILPHVERPVYEEGLGISGMVSDRVILVGTGELLRRHGLEPPSRDYEEKYRRGGKTPVYLASGGVLVAMFLVFYRSDRRRAEELRRLENNGVSLLVRSRDPNITPEMISDCFGLSIHSVSILSEHLGEIYDSLRTDAPEEVSAILATKGRAAAMMRMLTACVRQRGNIIIGVALQTAGSVLGFALAAFFTAFSGISQLSATSLLLFELFWAAAVAFIPKIRKP